MQKIRNTTYLKICPKNTFFNKQKSEICSVIVSSYLLLKIQMLMTIFDQLGYFELKGRPVRIFKILNLFYKPIFVTLLYLK